FYSCEIVILLYVYFFYLFLFFFFSSRRRHTRFSRDWSSDVCSSDLTIQNSLDITLKEQSHKAEKNVLPITLRAFKRRPPRDVPRSEERRVGKECRSRLSQDH